MSSSSSIAIELQTPISTPTPSTHTSTHALPTTTTTSSSLDAIAPEPDPSSDYIIASRLVDAAAPEGGHGWIVVLACATLTFWFIGTTYSWGVLQDALVKQGVSSASTLSFVGSLTVACLSIFAIVNARIVRWLGCRVTACVGITFFAGGELLSSFAVGNVAGLFVTTGLLMGIGCGLCFMVVSVAPAQYFSRKRGLANGIVYAGGGIGGAAISFMSNALIEKVGPAWTYRAISLMTILTGLPAAWAITERVPIHSTVFVDWTLFKDFRFAVLFVAGAVATFPLFVPPFFLPLYSGSLGLSPLVGAGLVAAFNFSSAIGRIGCGFACDRIGPLNTLFVALSLSALSMLTIWPISSTTAPLVLFVIINGAASGGFFASMPTVVGNVFGSARVSLAMGMIVTGWAGGYLMGAPIAGYLLSAYGGHEAGFTAYRPAIFYAGSMALASAALVALVRLRIQSRPFSKA